MTGERFKGVSLYMTRQVLNLVGDGACLRLSRSGDRSVLPDKIEFLPQRLLTETKANVLKDRMRREKREKVSARSITQRKCSEHGNLRERWTWQRHCPSDQGAGSLGQASDA